MLARSEFFQLIERIDPDFLGVILMVSAILTFVTMIVCFVSASRTVSNILVTRSTKQMVNELLSQGFSVDDVERLVYGKKRSKHAMAKMMRKAYRNQHADSRNPVPPIKQPA